MGRLSSNPGRWLLLEARLELGASLADVERMAPSPFSDELARVVRDIDTGEVVQLARLLRGFLVDPEETRTGPLRITIEAGP